MNIQIWTELEKLLLKWNLFSPLNGTLISFCFIFLLFLYLSFLSILSVSLSFLLNFLSKKVYWKRFQNFPSPFWWDKIFYIFLSFLYSLISFFVSIFSLFCVCFSLYFSNTLFFLSSFKNQNKFISPTFKQKPHQNKEKLKGTFM